MKPLNKEPFYKKYIKKVDEKLHLKTLKDTETAIIGAVENKDFTPMESVNILKNVIMRFTKRLKDTQREYYDEGRTYKQALKELNQG